MTEIEKQQQIAQITAWVQQIPQMKRIASDFNSYFLKHIAERWTRAYVTNEEFHEIMKQCGFRFKQDSDSPNYLYNLSEKWVRENERQLVREEDEVRHRRPPSTLKNPIQINHD